MSQRAKFVFFVLVAPSVLFLLLLWPLKTSRSDISADFSYLYAAGKIVRQGSASDLYDYETQARVQREYTVHRDSLHFNHPPFEAVLFVPFTYFSYPTAYLLWVLANLYVLGLVAFLLEPHAIHFGTGDRLLVVAISIVPLLAVLLQGQDSILLLLVYTLVYLSLRSNRQFAAGCFLAAGLFRFQLVLPFLIALCARKKARVFWGFAVVGAWLALVSWLLMGWQGLLSYPRLLWEMRSVAGSQSFHILPATMPNLRGFAHTLFAAWLPASSLQLVVLIGSAALLFWSMKKWDTSTWARPERTFDLQFASSLVITLLVSYHALIHDLSLLVLPAVLLFSRCSVGHSQEKSKPAAVALVVLLPLAQLYLVFFGGGQFSWLFCILLPFALEIRRGAGDRSSQG